MSVIVNVNNSNTSNRINKDLSFDIGEKFAARIISVDELKNEAVLMMTDGWEFAAQIEKLQGNLDGILRFEVKGFEDNKIILSIVNKEESEQNDAEAFKKLFENLNININKDDVELFSDIIEHNIPLTKENISNIKTIVNLKEKINQNKSDEFIDNFLQNKGIDKNSEMGKLKAGELRNFFNELGKLSNDDILTMKENNIPINPENIKSYLKIVKEPISIFNEIKQIFSEVNKDEVNNNEVNNHIQKNTESINNPLKNIKAQDSIQNTNIEEKQNINVNSEAKNSFIESLSEEALIKMADKIDVKAIENMLHEIEQNEIKKVPDELNKELGSVLNKDIENNNDNENNTPLKYQALNDKINNETEGSIMDTLLNAVKDKDEYVKNQNNKPDNLKSQNKEPDNLKNQNKEPDNIKIQNNDDNVIKIKNIKEDIEKTELSLKDVKDVIIDIKDKAAPEIIKAKINDKVLEMKNMIKDIITKGASENNNDFQNILSLNKENINDFKVFNSISNQYYYMNVPVEFNGSSYEFKLLVKDDRGKGKKIDTRNVKMVISVKTVNIGSVDAYIKVNDKIMNIDLKCNKEWVKLIDKNKQKLENVLNGGMYNVFINVSKKKCNADIVSCREFFNDNTISHINIKV